MNRYTSHELTIRAKKEFQQIQKKTPAGGSKTDYVYRGWHIVVNGAHTVLLVNYDVRPEGTHDPRKLSHAVQL